MQRRSFLATAALAAAPNILTAAKTAEPPLIVGHGSHRYRVEKNWSKANHAKVPLENCHEMIQASDGRLFLVTDQPQDNVLIYKTDGTLLDHWTLNSKGGHGLTLNREGGVDFLYITMSEGRVVKTTLDGKVVLELDSPHKTGAYPVDLSYAPTETAIGPNGDIYVIDGYGSLFILRTRPRENFSGNLAAKLAARKAREIHAGPRDRARHPRSGTAARLHRPHPQRAHVVQSNQRTPTHRILSGRLSQPTRHPRRKPLLGGLLRLP